MLGWATRCFRKVSIAYFLHDISKPLRYTSPENNLIVEATVHPTGNNAYRIGHQTLLQSKLVVESGRNMTFLNIHDMYGQKPELN